MNLAFPHEVASTAKTATLIFGEICRQARRPLAFDRWVFLHDS